MKFILLMSLILSTSAFADCSIYLGVQEDYVIEDALRAKDFFAVKDRESARFVLLKTGAKISILDTFTGKIQTYSGHHYLRSLAQIPLCQNFIQVK